MIAPLRSDTRANWIAANPVLAVNEAVVESDTGQVRVGNGVDGFAFLPTAGITPADAARLYPNPLVALDSQIAELVNASGEATPAALRAAFDTEVNTADFTPTGAWDWTGAAVTGLSGGSGGVALPTQTGNGGKFLKTDGSTASWAGAYALNTGIVMMPPPSGDTTGATDTANFKAALASLPSTTIYPTPSTKTGTPATFHQGTIILQAAPANVWQDQINANITGTPYYFGTAGSAAGDVGNIGPFVSVIGPGHNACVIRYLGTGDCLRMYNTVRPSSDTFDTLAAFAGKLDGFTIDGSLAGAGAVGLHAGDSEGFVIGTDFWVCNFVGGSVATQTTASKGIFWDNAVSWTENVHARANLYNNTIGVHFAPTTGDLSFMYSSHDYKVYGWPDQYGAMLDNGANFDQGSLRIRGNLLDGTSANAGALLAFGDSTGPNNRIADGCLDLQAEMNSGVPGGTFKPRTIYMKSAFYQIKNTFGVWNFGNSGWVASNYNPSFALVHTGPINGDATLQAAQAMPLAGVNVSGTAANGKVLTASSATAATWQTAASGSAYYPWTSYGYLGWAFDEDATGSSGIAATSQQIVAAKIPVPATITINNVVANVTAAGSALTGAQVGVIYDSSGNLLAQTTDQTTAWTSTGAKSMPLTTPLTVTGGPGVFIWVGVLSGGGTAPSLTRSVGTNNSGLSAPNLRHSRTSAGPYTTVPSTISIGSTSSNTYWFALT